MADDTPSDPQPVLLWIWRHFTLYVEEHRSLSNAAWAAHAASDGNTGAAAGAEVGSRWYDSDALLDLWYDEWREYERKPKAPEPKVVARVSVDPPGQVDVKSNDVAAEWTFVDPDNAQATYDRLHAVYGDRVHLVGLS